MSQGNTVNGDAAIITQNGRKKFLQKISVSTSGVVTPLATTFPDGTPVDKYALLCLQPDVDVYVELTSGATAVTVHTGARPGTRILQYQQETQYNSAAMTGVDVIGTVAGNLSVFVLTGA
jgi:hypothetical protein